MTFEDSGVPPFLSRPLRTVGKIRQLTFFDHSVQGFIRDVHLLHHLLHGDDDFRTISIVTHLKTTFRTKYQLLNTIIKKALSLIKLSRKNLNM